MSSLAVCACAPVASRRAAPARRVRVVSAASVSAAETALGARNAALAAELAAHAQDRGPRLAPHAFFAEARDGDAAGLRRRGTAVRCVAARRCRLHATAGGSGDALPDAQPAAAPEPSFEAVERILEASDAAADAAAAAEAGALVEVVAATPAASQAAAKPSAPAGRTARLAAALRAVGEHNSEDDVLDRVLAGSAAVLRALAGALTALSHTNAAWLRARRRKRWWKRRVFPQVPVPGGQSAALDGPLLRKAAPLALLFFTASFNLVLLSASKDALIVTAPGGGVEVIPFLMTYGVLPASVAFMLLYTAAVEALPPRAVFYAATAPLLAVYALFAFGLFPHAAALHPHAAADALAAALPAGLSGFVALLRNWTFSLYFVAAELWGGVVISLLFWGLANEVCAVRDAKAIYPLLGIAANVALIAGGCFLRLLQRAAAGGPPGTALRLTVASVLLGGAVMFVTKAYIDSALLAPAHALAQAQAAAAPPPAAPKKKKGPPPTAAESLAQLGRSPKIRNLAVLVVSYGMAHRLFEVAWKGALRAAHLDPGAFAAALGDVSTLTGCATIAMMLLGRVIFQRFGWGAAAAATPMAMLLAGGGFFAASLFATAGGGQAALLSAAVLAGSATQVVARSFKYSLFDPAKEMVYIESTKEEKTKGKATVDLVGSQVGKSGASLTMQALLLCTGSLSASLPVMATAYTAMCLYWLRAVVQLGSLLAREQSGDAQGAEAAPQE